MLLFFLQYLIPFPVEASFHLLCATIPGVVTSCMENSTNSCPLLSEKIINVEIRCFVVYTFL